MSNEKEIERPILYSALEVATICGVVNQTAINWINNGYLTAFKTPGGQYRVYPDDLADFMRARKMHVPAKLVSFCENKEAYHASTILIIDDDKSFNSKATDFIKEKFPKINVVQAFDGFDAGVKLFAHNPKCVILNVDLKGVDIVELCKKINDCADYEQPVIILIASNTSDQEKKKFDGLGIETFLKKPVNLEDLSSALESVF